MATSEKGNAMMAVLVLAVIALAGLIAYQQGLFSSQDEPQDIDINAPALSPTPVSSPVRTNPPATMNPVNPPGNQY